MAYAKTITLKCKGTQSDVEFMATFVRAIENYVKCTGVSYKEAARIISIAIFNQ